MASEWNLWVLLECIGEVSGWCCKEVYRFPHNITCPYSTCISSFLQQHPYFFVHFLKCFFVYTCLCYFCAIQQTLLKKHPRLFKKRDHVDMAI